MHELSLCRSIKSIVASASGDKKVAVIELDVGELRQVVPATLQYCWTMVSEGTLLEGSELAIRRIPGVIRCEDCGAETTLAGAPILRCGSCSSAAVRIQSGEEFIVTAIQLEV